MSDRQKYRPVEHRDLDEAAAHGAHHRSTGPKPQRLHQRRTVETHRMSSAHIKTVNPVTAGDRSMTHRVYEKGRKNQSRS